MPRRSYAPRHPHPPTRTPGAQAFSSFDTYLAPFVKVDNLTYEETKQCIESFVFGVNTPSRWGTQAPFSNITLDWVCPRQRAFVREMRAYCGTMRGHEDAEAGRLTPLAQVRKELRDA